MTLNHINLCRIRENIFQIFNIFKKWEKRERISHNKGLSEVVFCAITCHKRKKKYNYACAPHFHYRQNFSEHVKIQHYVLNVPTSQRE